MCRRNDFDEIEDFLQEVKSQFPVGTLLFFFFPLPLIFFVFNEIMRTEQLL